jgi:hypothetical protein
MSASLATGLHRLLRSSQRRAQRPMVQPPTTPTVKTLPTEGQDADDLPF